jgi:hypothetical protein
MLAREFREQSRGAACGSGARSMYPPFSTKLGFLRRRCVLNVRSPPGLGSTRADRLKLWRCFMLPVLLVLAGILAPRASHFLAHFGMS